MQVLAEKSPQKATIPKCKNGQNTTTTRNSGKICLFPVSGAYGARYLDPRTSRWVSADPAVSDYIPQTPTDDDARKRNQNLPGQGGVYNYLNLHVYHYSNNNPIKYVDPDGRAPWHFGRYPGWSEDAPQARVPYVDDIDKNAFRLGFTIDSAKIETADFTLRLWKGDYGIGGIGGEIGFYDGEGNMIKGAQLEQSLGLVNSTMQLFSKSDKGILVEYGESSGWVTAFDPLSSGKKENMYTLNTFTFETEDQAKSFASKIQGAVGSANNYDYNGREKVNSRINESDKKNVIVTFGLD